MPTNQERRTEWKSLLAVREDCFKRIESLEAGHCVIQSIGPHGLREATPSQIKQELEGEKKLLRELEHVIAKLEAAGID